MVHMILNYIFKYKLYSIMFSNMMKSFWSFFMVVLWQGYLRPVDMRQEIDKMNGNLQVYGKLFHLLLNLMMVYFCMNLFISFINEAHAVALVSKLVINFLCHYALYRRPNCGQHIMAIVYEL